MALNDVIDHEVKEVIPASSLGKDHVHWGLVAVGVDKAWQKTKGKGIKVAVLDTGVDTNHPDLKDNIKGTADFTGSKYGVEDQQGHGTHCAGIIAAVENGFGVVGVAPEADLYIAKVLSDDGNGNFNNIIKGIEWAVNHGVDVISMSLGSETRPPERMRKAIRSAVGQGIMFVAATGNENKNLICYPAAYDEVIAVSAVDRNCERADFSNYGIENAISAPGVDIVSTYKNGDYARLSGTSMATPLVAGAVALIVARHKEIFFDLKPSVEKTYKILSHMAEDLGDEGKDDYYGAGVLNLSKLP